MKLFDPWGFDDFIITSVALQFPNLRIINVSFDVVTEIREEKNFTLAVPKEGMV